MSIEKTKARLAAEAAKKQEMSPSAWISWAIIAVLVVVIVIAAIVVFNVIRSNQEASAREARVEGLQFPPDTTTSFVVINDEDSTIDKFVIAESKKKVPHKPDQTVYPTDGSELHDGLLYLHFESSKLAYGLAQDVSAIAKLDAEDFIWYFNTYVADRGRLFTESDRSFSAYETLQYLYSDSAYEAAMSAIDKTELVAGSHSEVSYDTNAAAYEAAGYKAEAAMSLLGIGKQAGVGYDYNYNCVKQDGLLSPDQLSANMAEMFGGDLAWYPGHHELRGVTTEKPCGFLETTPVG